MMLNKFSSKETFILNSIVNTSHYRLNLQDVEVISGNFLVKVPKNIQYSFNTITCPAPYIFLTS